MLIDYIFIPEGNTKTMGELKKEDPTKATKAWGNAEKNFIFFIYKHRDSAFTIRKRISSHKYNNFFYSSI